MASTETHAGRFTEWADSRVTRSTHPRRRRCRRRRRYAPLRSLEEVLASAEMRLIELPEQLVDALPTSGDVNQLAQDWRPMLDALRVGDSEAAVKAADAFMSRGVVAEKKAATVRSWLNPSGGWGCVRCPGCGRRSHARHGLADLG
jgi:hypothetical protein